MGITISYIYGYPQYLDGKKPKTYGKTINYAIQYRFRLMIRIGQKIINFYI